MDFITALPPCRHNGQVFDSILVVCDRYSKMVRYVPTRTTIKAAELFPLLFQHVFSLFGMPSGIVSDRGSLFTSDYWSDLCYIARVQRRLSTAWHPQTDGQTERQNQVVEHYLRIHCNDRQDNWAGLLPAAEFAYNNSAHASHGESPFFTVYGYHPEFNLLVADDSHEERVPDARERIETIQKLRKTLETKLQQAADYQATYYNRNHKPLAFKSGDKVWLSMKNIPVKRPSKKLADKFSGPYVIEEPIGKQAYRLNLPTAWRQHNVFHISLLKPYRPRDGEKDAMIMTAPEIVNDVKEYAVEQILSKKRRG